MNKHSGHQFDTLEKKVFEERRKASESLTVLELGEKPIREKKEFLSQALKNWQSSMRQYLMYMIQSVESVCLAALDEHCEKLNTYLDHFSENSTGTVDLQQKLQSLLTSSNAQLLNEFESTVKEFELNQTVREILMKNEGFIFNNCARDLINTKFESFTEGLMNDIKSTISIDNASWPLQIAEAKFRYHFGDMHSQKFLIHNCDWRGPLCLKITNENGQLLVQKFVSTNSGIVSAHTRRVTFDSKVDRCFGLRTGGKIIVVLFTENNIAYKFDSEEIQLSEITLPPYNHLLYPYFYAPSADGKLKIYWCYWDEEVNLIKFTHDNWFTVECDSLPQIRRNDSFSSQSLIFVTTNDTAITADALNRFKCKVSFGNSCGEISCTTVFIQLYLFWFCNDESVFICMESSGKLTIPVKYKWDRESFFTHIEAPNGFKLKLLPGIRNTSGEFESYLFIAQPDE